jgi:enoyl-CoA hydratase / 3-hydroxyacyl-CoA dehydrogenase
MFIFKAAVVGAGTMGGQIAQTIAAAGIDVVLKDVKQEFIDAGLEEARNVTSGQFARLVKKEKLTQEQADAATEEVMGRITGTETYEGFGDVDLVIEAVPERMEIKRARCRSPRSATRRCGPRRSSASTTSTRRRSCR